jgi:hypothetical protein
MDSRTALAGRRQVIDRFAQALQRLGSTELYVRIGGVYSLEHVLRNCAEHHNDIVEVLAAFVRAGAARSTIEREYGTWVHPVVGTFPDQPGMPVPDVQAALTVLAHRPHRPEQQKINLAGLDLAGAWLPGADLVNAWFMDADLTTAMLDHALLYRACLRDADLTRAHLDSANLTDAVLENADLSRADLKNANLTEAFFGNANLTCADLGNSDLTRAHLDGVDLTGAHLGPGAPAVPQGWTVDPTGKLERDLQDQPPHRTHWRPTLPDIASPGRKGTV